MQNVGHVATVGCVRERVVLRAMDRNHIFVQLRSRFLIPRAQTLFSFPESVFLLVSANNTHSPQPKQEIRKSRNSSSSAHSLKPDNNGRRRLQHFTITVAARTIGCGQTKRKAHLGNENGLVGSKEKNRQVITHVDTVIFKR